MELTEKAMEYKVHRQTYSNEEAFKAAVDYFKKDELAARVWVNKYALKNSAGDLFELTPNDMHWRLANEIARIEKNYPNPISAQELFDLFKDFKYIVPQGSPMAGIGNNIQVGSLSNCFVIGNQGGSDSYGGILKTDQEQVQLMKRRGGVGQDLSHIRPKGSPVKNSALTSTGIVPFMERYSNSTREVAQDGRRGALMLSISIKHPDSEKFIDAKLEQGKVTGANVSVKIDDDFMRSVVGGTPYTQQYPVESSNPRVTADIDAQSLWKKIIHNAWRSAEPGILFWDTIIRESVPDCYADLGFKTVSTNPCGEIPLCPYDSCRLIALNLYSYVENPFTPQAKFNFELFTKHVGYTQRIMDDIIDLELEKIDNILNKIKDDPETDDVKLVERELWMNIRKKAVEGRRTGVGITAEGDMLAALGLTYCSDNAIDFSVEVQKTLAISAYQSSINMARERGAFPVYSYEKELKNPFIRRLFDAAPELEYQMRQYGRRNIALLTIAPTGSTSMLTQTTSGIEPVFQPYYLRRRKVNPNDVDAKVDFVDQQGDSWQEYFVMHHKFKTWMDINGYDANTTFKPEELDEIVKKSPYYLSTSADINWVSKVKMQGAIQKWVDHSISVTINLPESATEELVGDLYVEAWKSGCKGMTVYREGSRDGVLISANQDKPEEKFERQAKRPIELEAEVVRFQNNKEKWIAFVGIMNNRPYEIFTGLADEDGLYLPKMVQKGIIIKEKNADGSSRYDFQYANKMGHKTKIEGLSYMFNKEYWNYAKLISGVLRHGMEIEDVVNLVEGLHFEDDSINNWISGVERALKKYIPDGTEAKKGTCTNCGSHSLVYQEGCLTCKSCGSSKCG